MSRRLLPMILVIGMVASLFVGIVGVASAEKVELTWFHCCGQADRTKLFDEMAREFERLNPGVTIKDSYPGGSGYSDSIRVAIAGGLAPDVMWFGNGLWNFIDVLMPLDNLIAKSAMMREISPSILASHKWDGKLIGIPYGVNTHTFFYNKDALSATGVSMPKDWTWTDTLAMAKKLTKDTNSDGNVDQWGIQLQELSHSLWQGGDFFSPDFKKVTINNPANIAALQLYADMILGKHGVHVPSGQGDSLSNFIAGKVALAPRGVFDIAGITNGAQFDWDVTLFPKLEVGGKEYRSSWYSTECWSIYSGTKHPDLAQRFVEFLMSKENMVKFANLGGIVPSQASVAVNSFLKVPKPANIKAFTDALNWWKKNSANPAGLSQTVGGYYSAVFKGEQPASTAVPEIEKLMQQGLDEFWAKRAK